MITVVAYKIFILIQVLREMLLHGSPYGAPNPVSYQYSCLIAICIHYFNNSITFQN